MSHNDYQRRYFARPQRTWSRMAPVATPYAHRHLAAVTATLSLAPRSHVLELGCGMGRFSRLLAEAGHRVTAVDLSPDLIAELRAAAASQPWGERLEAVCADTATVAARVDGPFDAVVGFFFLHHLPRLAPTLEAAATLLAPGGGIAFCEPNAWYLPFYAQILLTPGMTWEGDRGVARMRAGVVLPALRAAGFEVGPVRRYGLFPPALANRAAGRAIEATLERLPVPKAFQVFHGKRGQMAQAA